jgi:hypothetical protein
LAMVGILSLLSAREGVADDAPLGPETGPANDLFRRVPGGRSGPRLKNLRRFGNFAA